MLLNSLCIITGIIGFLIITIIIANKKANPIMNTYMILLIFIISCRFFIYGIINFIANNSHSINTYSQYSNLTSVAIPICYLYFKNLDSKQGFSNKDLLHFIFPVTHFFITFEIYHFITPKFSIKIFLLFLFLVFLTHYIFQSYKVLKTTIWNKNLENKTLIKRNRKIHNWTLFLFTALVLTSIRLSVSLSIEASQNGITRGLSFQWISSIIWIAVLIKILVTPEILYGYSLLNEKLIENRNSNLMFNTIWQIQPICEINNVQHLVLQEKINNNLQNYFEAIEKASLEGHLFRDPKFALTDLANKLSIPKSHLSYLFKYHASLSFSEYKKTIRIEDAIQLIDSGYLKNNTLDSLSKKIGFTSYNPFFTSFKEITGVSPLEYINTINSIVT